MVSGLDSVIICMYSIPVWSFHRIILFRFYPIADFPILLLQLGLEWRKAQKTPNRGKRTFHIPVSCRSAGIRLFILCSYL